MKLPPHASTPSAPAQVSNPYTPLPRIIGRPPSASTGSVYINRLYNCIQRLVLYLLLQFFFVDIYFILFYFFWGDETLIHIGWLQSHKKFPPHAACNKFPQLLFASASSHGWYKTKPRMAFEGSTSSPSMRSRSIFVPNGAPTLFALLATRLNVNNIAMRERRISYLHQFLAVGVSWESKSNYEQRPL